MRPKRRAALAVRREVVRWTFAGVAALLLAAALVPPALGWQRGSPGARRLAYPDDPLIDQPYREAKNRWLIFVHIILILYMLLGINTVCDVYFTNALEVMWKKWHIKPDVAGATFMAAGGSAPEFFTSLIGAFAETDVGFGTIVGSAVFNVLFVIGLCGFASKTPISLSWWPLFRDCTYYILALSLLAFCAHDWSVGLGEAALLFLAYAAYCALMYFNDSAEALALRLGGRPAARGAPAKASQVAPMPAEDAAGAGAGAGGGAGGEAGEGGASGGELRGMAAGEAPPGPPEHHIGRAQQPDSPCAALPLEAGDVECSTGFLEGRDFALDGFGELKGLGLGDLGDLGARDGAFAFGKAGEAEAARPAEAPEEEEEDPVEELMRQPEGARDRLLWALSLPIILPMYWLIPKPTESRFLLTFLCSLVWIALLTYLLVWWMETAGEVFHVHYIVMSLTVLAAGTSIPDAVSSVAVARKGLGDTAISSSIGSNIFDILVGLPVPWLIKILCVEANPSYAVRIRSPYMTFFVLLLLFMVLCVIFSIHMLGWKLNRPLGLCMALLYVAFLATALFVYSARPAALNFWTGAG